jgi:hypothetical protein
MFQHKVDARMTLIVMVSQTMTMIALLSGACLQVDVRMMLMAMVSQPMKMIVRNQSVLPDPTRTTDARYKVVKVVKVMGNMAQDRYKTLLPDQTL